MTHREYMWTLARYAYLRNVLRYEGPFKRVALRSWLSGEVLWCAGGEEA